jgi:hypothetical protein
MIDRQVTFVQNSAAAIIDHLLFNKKNDPYLSLGLPRYAGKAEVNRRWKRLIVLYHPDKYPDQKEYEEKAKKINEAYDEIRKIKENAAWYKPVNSVYGDSLPKADAAHYAKYLRYLPLFILVLTIFMAVISILFFLKTIKDDRHLYNGNPKKLSGYTSSNGLRTPALMRHADHPFRERQTAAFYE